MRKPPKPNSSLALEAGDFGRGFCPYGIMLRAMYNYNTNVIQLLLGGGRTKVFF